MWWLVAAGGARAAEGDSVGPVLEQLVATVGRLESEGLQVIGLEVHRIPPGVTGASSTHEVQAGPVALYASLDDRIAGGLGLVVTGPDGREAAREDHGEHAVNVSLEAVVPTPFEVRVDVIRNAADAAQATYYLVVSGYDADRDVITALPVLETATAVGEYAEGEIGHRFVGFVLSALFDGEPDAMRIDIPQQTYADCVAVLAGSGHRTRKVELSVADANLVHLGRSRQIGHAMRLAHFVNDERDPRHYFEVSAKTRRGYGDTHAMLFVACRPPGGAHGAPAVGAGRVNSRSR